MIATQHPRTALISGIGLMGGSLAWALRNAGWNVLLHHHRAGVATAAADRGWGTAIERIEDAQDAEIAVVCTPVSAIPDTVRAIARSTSAICTDIGSTKGTICRRLSDLGDRFLGSHPMCGSHHQGMQHADPNLYQDRLTILTPNPGTHRDSIDVVTALWVAVGCRVTHLDPQSHDAAVAQASHLPHILSSLAASLLEDRAAPVAAGGFRDTTRIAAASPELWQDILISNVDAITPLLELCQQRLSDLLAALERRDQDAVNAWLAAGKAGRARYEGTSPGRR